MNTSTALPDVAFLSQALSKNLFKLGWTVAFFTFQISFQTRVLLVTVKLNVNTFMNTLNGSG